MKAPEIIYINGFSAFATEPVKDGVQYIRKKALLEWAKGFTDTKIFVSTLIAKLEEQK